MRKPPVHKDAVCPTCGSTFTPTSYACTYCSAVCKFEAFFARDNVEHNTNEKGCWMWKSSIERKGYGRLRFKKRKLLAHRVSAEKHLGPVPSGLCVLHECDNPLCVNPSHLFLGTKKDNNTDRNVKGRSNPRKGEAVRYSKLTADVVLELRRLYTRSSLKVAASLGISQATMSDVLTRRTWKHV